MDRCAYRRVIPAVGLVSQAVAGLFDRLDTVERSTRMYLVVARARGGR